MKRYTTPVSVIVPCYNNESFLRHCIESIIDGSNPAQIIIIDDCSTDNSLKIAYELKNKHECIDIFKTKINSGAAKARRIGFENATEDLVAWVDSDDILESGAVLDAYKKIINDVDLCIWEVWRLRNETELSKASFNPAEPPKNGIDAVLSTLDDWNMHTAGVARKEIYLTAYNELSIDTFNSDELLSRIVLKNCRKFALSNKKYIYRINPNSTTNTINDKHIGRMKSNIWLIKFFQKIPNANVNNITYKSISYAWGLNKNSINFSQEKLSMETAIFINDLTKIKRFWIAISINPKYLILFLMLLGKTFKFSNYFKFI